MYILFPIICSGAVMVSMENSDVPTIVLALFIVTALSILLYYLFWKVGYIYCVVITTLVY